METLIVIGVFLLAAGGLAVGLVLTGKPPETSCGGLACIGGGQCEVCPRRKAEENRT